MPVGMIPSSDNTASSYFLASVLYIALPSLCLLFNKKKLSVSILGLSHLLTCKYVREGKQLVSHFDLNVMSLLGSVWTGNPDTVHTTHKHGCLLKPASTGKYTHRRISHPCSNTVTLTHTDGRHRMENEELDLERKCHYEILSYFGGGAGLVYTNLIGFHIMNDQCIQLKVC